MRRYQHSSSVLDGNPLLDGDGAVLGVNMMVSPDDLPAGVLAGGYNLRIDRGEAVTRGAFTTMHWGNEADVNWSTNPPTALETYADSSLYYYTYLLKGGPIYGAGRYNDPDSEDYLIRVQGDHLLACRQFLAPIKVRFPAGESITQPCQVLTSGARLMIRRAPNDGEPLLWDGSASACVLMSSLTGDKPSGYRDLPNGNWAFYFKGRTFMLHDRDQMARSNTLEFFYDPASADDTLNFGTADRLAGHYVLNRNTFLVFGDHSVNAIYNFEGDLTGLRFDAISLKYGTRAPGSIAGNGPLCLFLAADGVRTVEAVDADTTIVSEKALSYPLQPIIDRIDWTQVAPDPANGTHGAQAEVVGGRYYLTLPIYDEDGNPPSGNNALIVYNLETGQWEGWWEGATALDLVALMPYRYYDKERLYAIDRAGYVLLVGEETVDTIGDTSNEIVSEWITRGYNARSPEQQRGILARLNLRTLDPTWSLWVRNQDALTEAALESAVTFDRTKQLLQGRDRFVEDNRNGDAMNPGREDYSVVLGEYGMFLPATGVQWDRLRGWEWNATLRVEGTWVQLRLRNTTGRMSVTGVRLVAREGRRDERRKI